MLRLPKTFARWREQGVMGLPACRTQVASSWQVLEVAVMPTLWFA